MEGNDYAEALRRVRDRRPLVHHITNYVTVNDCANITICIGAAPVMADALDEVGEMVRMASALVLNIGTLNPGQVDSMLLAGKEANRANVPIVLDPVGVGATKMRTEAARMLLRELKISVLKGNAGEVGVLAGTGGKVRGVDSDGADGDHPRVVRDYARAIGVVVVMSGPTDVISDGTRTYLVENGHAMMGRVSGTGCMASSIAGAFVGANEDKMVATVSALASFGIAGEMAAAKAAGPGTFKVSLFDEVAALTPEIVSTKSRVRVVR